MKLKHILFTLAALAFFSTAQAQVKVGANPGTIGTNSALEVEATNGNKTVIQKDNGNVGIGTATPGNKLEITQGTAGNSGLRFSNLNSSSPASTSVTAFLGVNASGDVVVTAGGTSRQYLSVARQGSHQSLTAPNNIIPNGILNTNSTIPYDVTTGVATLTVGKTYQLFASLHVSFATSVFLQYGFVNANTNAPLALGSTAEMLSPNAGGSGGGVPATASSGTISFIYTPVAGAEQIRLRAINMDATKQMQVRSDLFSGFTIVEL